jgi:hypothetical protein
VTAQRLLCTSLLVQKRSGTARSVLVRAQIERSAQFHCARLKTRACVSYTDAYLALCGPSKSPTATNLSYRIKAQAILPPMNPLASFATLIATAQGLADAVNVRDNVYLRPALACKAVAARLGSGLILLRAFLRRLIILIALDLEWSLVDKRGPMKRPHGRKATSSAGFSLGGLDTQNASPWLNSDGPAFKPREKTVPGSPTHIDMTKLYAHFDYLAGIAADPLAKAKRLAFHLARAYPYNQYGIIIAPQGPKRIAGRWGTRVSASYDAMAASILTKSRTRPPPLPPPRTHWPTITAL